VGVSNSQYEIQDLTGGALSIAEDPRMFANKVGYRSKPVYRDDFAFNSRLIWHGFAAQLYQPSVGVVNLGLPGPGHIVCSKLVQPDQYCRNLVNNSLLVACTHWIPFMTNTGIRLVLGVTPAAGADRMSQILAKIGEVSLDAWMLRKVTVVPNLITSSAAGSVDDWFKGRRSAKNSNPSSEPAADVGDSPDPSPDA